MKKITLLFSLCMLGFMGLSFAATQTVTVNLTTSSPQFTRPLVGNPPSGLSPQTGCYYSVFAFTAPVSGTYTFEAQGAVDNFGCLYANSFSGSFPLTNCMRSNDNKTTTNNNYYISRTLTAGVTYYLVSTMFYGNTTGSYDVVITGPFNSVLPVQISAFNATTNAQVVDVNWTTASEKNCSYFNVQRSADGTHYNNIAQVLSKAVQGFSEEELTYQYTDNNPMAVNYYRLEQVDIDGKTMLTDVVKVDNSVAQTSINLFPNPVSNQLNVQFYCAKPSKATFTLFDITGKKVISKSVSTAQGNHHEIIDMSGLTNGTYFLELMNSAKEIGTYTVIKQ